MENFKQNLVVVGYSDSEIQHIIEIMVEMVAQTAGSLEDLKKAFIMAGQQTVDLSISMHELKSMVETLKVDIPNVKKPINIHAAKMEKL